MATSDTAMNFLRHRVQLVGWVFVGCVLPGALLYAAGVAPGVVLTGVFVGTALVPWVLGPFAVRKRALPKNHIFSWLFGPALGGAGIEGFPESEVRDGKVHRYVLLDKRYYRAVWYVVRVVVAIVFILSVICWIALHLL